MHRISAMARHIAIWGVIAIIVLSPTQYGIRIMDRATLSIVDPLIWLVFAVWMVYAFLDARMEPNRETSARPVCRVQRWLRARPRPPFLHAMLVALAALSVLRATDRLLAAKDVFQWIEYLLVACVLFFGMCGTLIPRRRIAWLMLGAATVVVGLGLIHYGTSSVPDFGVRATFGNLHLFGGYLAMMLPFAFGLLLFDRHWLRRLWYGLVVAAGLVAMLAGGSFLATGLTLAAMAAARGTRYLLALLAVALLAIGLVRPTLPRDNADIMHRSIMLCEPDDESMMHERYAEWQAALFMTADNLWRGVGIGNYQINVGQWFGTLPDKAEPAEPDSQNLYLVVASTIGLPGALCLIGLLLQAMITALKRFATMRNPLERGIALGAFGAILGFSINSLWSPLLVRGIGIPLMLVFALAYPRDPESNTDTLTE